MNLELLEEYLKYIVTYLIPIASLVVSVTSLIKSTTNSFDWLPFLFSNQKLKSKYPSVLNL